MASSKKGETKWEVISIVPLAVVAFFLISHGISINTFAKEKSAVETCRLSVIASSVDVSFGVHAWSIELFKASAPNPFHIDCTKRESFITKDAVKSGGFETELSTDKESRENQLKDFILDEMSSCWRSFGDAADKVYLANAGDSESITLDDSACFYCSETFIDKNFFKNGESEIPESITLHDFYHYANNKIRVTDGKSYVGYLTGGTDLDYVPEKDLTIEPNKMQWSTVFVIKKVDNSGWGLSILDAITREIKSGFLPKPDSGIVDCYLTTDDGSGKTVVGTNADDMSIGCKNGNINGFIFGRVAAGYDKRSLFSLSKLPFTRDTARFPMTVRFVPTEEVFRNGQCKKLY